MISTPQLKTEKNYLPLYTIHAVNRTVNHNHANDGHDNDHLQ